MVIDRRWGRRGGDLQRGKCFPPTTNLKGFVRRIKPAVKRAAKASTTFLRSGSSGRHLRLTERAMDGFSFRTIVLLGFLLLAVGVVSMMVQVMGKTTNPPVSYECHFPKVTCAPGSGS
jgi:hypothetical protein